MEEIEYEGLPSNFSFSAHLLAGAMAGITEHGIIYPLDSIKTRMQIFTTHSPVFTSISQTVRSVASAEGIHGLFRGFGSIILGAGPSHAIYFAVYEDVKRYLQDYNKVHPILASAISGASATCIAEAFGNPFDVIKQRMQIGYASIETCPVPKATCSLSSVPPCPTNTVAKSSSIIRYTSLYHCFKHTLRTEGFSAFYVSYPTTLAMAVPYQTLNFTTYEFLRSILHRVITTCNSTTDDNDDDNNTIIYDPHAYSPLTHAISGGVAGAVAAGITTPLDVSKTLLQTRGVSTCPRIRAAKSLWDAAQIIWAREGLRGFMRGSSARIGAAIPAAGISWLTYEYFKWILQGREFFEAKNKEFYATRSANNKFI